MYYVHTIEYYSKVKKKYIYIYTNASYTHASFSEVH